MRTDGSEWQVFPTPLGYLGLAWDSQGVTALLLPEPDPARLEQEMRGLAGRPAAVLPDWVALLQRRLYAHLGGDLQDFRDVPLPLADATGFQRAVYAAARCIPAGRVCSYAELACAMGKPGAARAVGSALGRNPVPILVPCHRVLAAGGRLGGFTAHGGLAAKAALLAVEGVSVAGAGNRVAPTAVPGPGSV